MEDNKRKLEDIESHPSNPEKKTCLELIKASVDCQIKDKENIKLMECKDEETKKFIPCVENIKSQLQKDTFLDRTSVISESLPTCSNTTNIILQPFPKKINDAEEIVSANIELSSKLIENSKNIPYESSPILKDVHQLDAFEVNYTRSDHINEGKISSKTQIISDESNIIGDNSIAQATCDAYIDMVSPTHISPIDIDQISTKDSVKEKEVSCHIENTPKFDSKEQFKTGFQPNAKDDSSSIYYIEQKKPTLNSTDHGKSPCALPIHQNELPVMSNNHINTFNLKGHIIPAFSESKEQNMLPSSDIKEKDIPPSSNLRELDIPPFSDYTKPVMLPSNDFNEQDMPPSSDLKEKDMSPSSDLKEQNMPPSSDLKEQNMPPSSDLKEQNIPLSSDLKEENIPPSSDLKEKDMPPSSDSKELHMATSHVTEQDIPPSSDSKELHMPPGGSDITDQGSLPKTTLKQDQNNEFVSQAHASVNAVSKKIKDTGFSGNEITDTKNSDKVNLNEESQNNVSSSNLILDHFMDINYSKTDNISMQSEATETRTSSVMIANSDSLSGTFYSNENSPAFSTPIGSCQVSAASSPKPFDGLSKLSDDQCPLNIVGKPVTSKSISSKKKSKKKGKKQVKSVSCPIVIDEETRMDANVNNANMEINPDDDSQSSTGTSSKRESKKFRTEVIVPESTEVFTVDKVIEYVWPLDDFAEHYFIQEHISRYLGIMSFKRKYPDIRRRFIEKTEKVYLKERGIVNEMACDMGLTAARSEDVMDIIFNDFPDKYEELHKDLRDRKERKFKEEGRVAYQVASLDKSKMQEYSKKAAADAARWNLAFNRERFDERRYSFDLQSFTMHRPTGRCAKLPVENTKLGSYPVAVLPGQYTDYYRKYSTSELKALPVHSVLTGPFTAEELNADTNQDTEAVVQAKTEEKLETKEIADTVDSVLPNILDPLSAGKQPRCKECNGGRDRNKVGKAEPLIICGSCRTPSHPTCIDLTLAMLQKIESYGWQCMECKTCAHCNDPNDEERMIFCDMCDRGYHIYCVGLRKVPNGRWHCRNCAYCFSCGTRSPAGNEIVKVADWQHEFKKNKETKEVNYVCTLCLTCDRYWKRRMYCNSCWKVYKSLSEGGMVKCAACPKYIHREGCSTLLDNENLCSYCVKTRKNTAMNHSRILAAAKKKMAAGF